MSAKEIRLSVSEKAGKVSGLLLKPKGAKALLVLAHGAGAGMRHKFMEEICVKLSDRGIATLRYQFPYMEKRIKRPDSEAVLTATVRSAVAEGQKFADGIPIFAGGKSMGGRMTSLAAATEALDGVQGLLVDFSDTPGRVQGPPLVPGQDTRAIMAELGHEPAAVDDLIASGVLTAVD